MNDKPTGLGEWLSQICRKQGLSLRQTAEKTGLSHTTIRDIMNGTRPSPESIRKLAQAFGGDGAQQKLALEDYLLVLAGSRTPRPDGQELSQPLARLIDRLSQFSEPQLKIIGRFADFLVEMEKK
jgi:transcriptional regulator with XRE-family HTH domain